MSITTVEALDALAVGTTITVSTPDQRTKVDWVRVVQGWQSGTAVIESAMLSGVARAGLVVDRASMRPSVGEWYHGRTYDLYVLSVTETEARCLAFHRTAQNMTTSTVSFTRMRDRYTRMSDVPTTLVTSLIVKALVEAHADLLREHETATTKIETLRRRPDPGPLREQVRAARIQLDSLLESLGQ